MSDRVTIAFADAHAAIQGLAIVGVGTLLVRDGQVTVAPSPELVAEGAAWKVGSAGAYELTLTPWGTAAVLADGGQISLGTATGAIGSQQLDGLAALTRSGPSDGLALERSLSIFFDAALGFALNARRALGALGHGDERLDAVAFRGEALDPAMISVARLSSTYDSAGALTHAGIELWENDDSEFALRIGGEALAHGELRHPTGARTRVTFVAWHHSGRRGIGSYEITTAAEPVP